MPEPPRSRQTRQLAKAALVRIVHAYGAVPEFVLLGGLVPDLLCTRSRTRHVGTTDIDVQVDLEIAHGSASATRLEAALREAGFVPDSERAWRWRDDRAAGLVVKAEFLADLDGAPSETTVYFDDCQDLAAVNLRGTGFVARDWVIRQISIEVDGRSSTVDLRVAGLAGYLLAKTHAAHGRRATKDWYDIAYVHIYNDDGGPAAAARQLLERFGPDLVGQTRTALDDLSANFTDPSSQGAEAFAEIMLGLYPESDWDVLVNDAAAAAAAFVAALGPTSERQP